MMLPAAFGVGIRSSFCFGRLPSAPSSRGSISFTVSRVAVLPLEAAEPENAFPAQGRTMQVYVQGQTLRVTVPGLLTFHLDPEVRSVHCVASPAATDTLVEYWFLGQALPILLLFDGSTELLHATCAEIDGAGVAFLGCSGVGKSTLLDYVLKQGGSLVTDEHLALDRSDLTRIYPSIPCYRPYRSAEDLGIPAPRTARGAVQLRALYALRPADPAAPVTATGVSSAETIALLLNNRQYNLFNPRLTQFFPLVEKRFAGLAALARKVPLRRLHVPRALDRLGDVYSFIREDLAAQDAGRAFLNPEPAWMAQPA